MARMSKHSVRQNNEKNVLQAVINDGPIARSQVAKALKLNKVTVSDIFSQLLDEGYLEVVGSGEGSQAGGRKPTLHRFNPHYGYVVSFDLGFHATDMMVTTLTGQVLHSANFWGEGAPIAERLAFMVQQVQAFQEAIAGQTLHGLLGVAIGVHGIVNHNQVVDSPFMALDGIELAPYFEQALAVPVVLENEANLAALYARDFTELAAAQQDLVALSIHKGIGAGVVIDGQLFRGANGGAGEVGRALAPDDQGQLVKIETLCSEDAVLAQLATVCGHALKAEEIASLTKTATPAVQPVLAQFVMRLTLVIHNSVASYDPKIVVINSGLIAANPDLLTDLTRALTAAGHAVPLTLGEAGEHAITLGGTTLIVHQVLGLGSRQLHF